MSRTLMKTMRAATTAALIVGSIFVQHVVRAQASGIKRTDLQRHDLSVPACASRDVQCEPPLATANGP